MNRNYLFLALSAFTSSDLLSLKSKPAKKGVVTRDVTKTVAYIPKSIARNKVFAGGLFAAGVAAAGVGAMVYNHMNDENKKLENVNTKLSKTNNTLKQNLEDAAQEKYAAISQAQQKIDAVIQEKDAVIYDVNEAQGKLEKLQATAKEQLKKRDENIFQLKAEIEKCKKSGVEGVTKLEQELYLEKIHHKKATEFLHSARNDIEVLTRDINSLERYGVLSRKDFNFIAALVNAVDAETMLKVECLEKQRIEYRKYIKDGFLEEHKKVELLLAPSSGDKNLVEVAKIVDQAHEDLKRGEERSLLEMDRLLDEAKIAVYDYANNCLKREGCGNPGASGWRVVSPLKNNKHRQEPKPE